MAFGDPGADWPDRGLEYCAAVASLGLPVTPLEILRDSDGLSKAPLANVGSDFGGKIEPHSLKHSWLSTDSTGGGRRVL